MPSKEKTGLTGAEDGSGEIPGAGGKEMIWTEKPQNKILRETDGGINGWRGRVQPESDLS